MGFREYEKAIAAYQAAIRLVPLKPAESVYVFLRYMNMGTCYEKMGKVEQANAWFEKAGSGYHASDVR